MCVTCAVGRGWKGWYKRISGKVKFLETNNRGRKEKREERGNSYGTVTVPSARSNNAAIIAPIPIVMSKAAIFPQFTSGRIPRPHLAMGLPFLFFWRLRRLLVPI